MGGLNRNDHEDIEIYFSQKLAGSISDKDLIYINTLIAQNEEVYQRWQAFCSDFKEEDIQDQFSRLNDYRVWKPITAEELYAKPSVHRPLSVLVSKKYVPLYAAAILIAIFLINDPAGLLIPKKVQPSISKPQQAAFVLKLADGRVIDLSKLNDGDQNGIHYNSTDRLLSFDGALVSEGTSILKVPAGRSLSMLLSDGSKLMINSATEVTFPMVFDDQKREISIQGEAYLTVAKDPARPFTVHTRSGEVQVLGTEFNLNSYDPGVMTVTLVQGSVKVVTPKSQVTLKPGMIAIADQKENISVAQSKDNHALSWKNGIYYFHNSDLKEIKEILERWYNLNIYIDNPDLLNQRFTGALDKTGEVSIFLDNLTAVTTIKYTFDSAHNVHFN